jgi:subtilisin family serine protease
LTDPTYDALRHSATKNLAWFARVAGTLVLTTDLTVDGEVSVEALEARSQDVDALIDALVELIDIGEMPEPADAEIHNINRNREATTAIYRSVPTVKADAAQRLFDVRGRGVTWAILDSGIDATHWAFRERDVNGSPAEEPFTKKTTRRGEIWENHTRIRATYDFTRIRDFLSDGADESGWTEEQKQARAEVQDSLHEGRAIDWQQVGPALAIPHDDKYSEHHIPVNVHGTHVAGILGADWRGSDSDEDVLPFHRKKDDRPTHPCARARPSPPATR